jgi:hypothetical protein
VFNISGERYVTFDGIARACAKAMGAPEPELVHFNAKDFDFGKKKVRTAGRVQERAGARSTCICCWPGMEGGSDLWQELGMIHHSWLGLSIFWGGGRGEGVMACICNGLRA